MGGGKGRKENELSQTLLYPKILPDQAVHSPWGKAAVSFCYPFALQLKQQQFMLVRIPGFGEVLLRILKHGSFYAFKNP